MLRSLVFSLCVAAAAGLGGCAAEEALTGGGGSGSGSGAGVTFTGLYQGYFQGCKGCHTPTAPGRTPDQEQSLDFTSRETAYQTLTEGTATGLKGNQEACNGVPFIGNTAETSLVMAVLDENVRGNFDDPANSGCDVDAISDMTLKVGTTPSSAFINDLADWIDDGAPNN